MAKKRVRKYGVEVEDVGGRFAQFVQQAPTKVREHMNRALRVAAIAIANDMRAHMHVGPDAPHIRNAISWKVGPKARVGRIGLLEDVATQPAGPDASGEGSTMAHVALYEEYVNKHGGRHGAGFMRVAAAKQRPAFIAAATAALRALEDDLSRGGGGMI